MKFEIGDKVIHNIFGKGIVKVSQRIGSVELRKTI